MEYIRSLVCVAHANNKMTLTAIGTSFNNHFILCNLSNINNFVHPYNSFTNIKTTISESGEINLEITYLYSEEEINILNKE